MAGVVVGVDGSESSLRAVEWAAAEAARRRGKLTVCAVLYGPPEDAVLWVGPDMVPILNDEIVRRATYRAKQVAPEVSVTQRMVVGTPTQQLLDEARHADLMVVGSRGHGAFTGLLLGSVSEQIAEHAECPVAVVHN